MTCTPSTSTSWWSRTWSNSVTSPGRGAKSTRSRRAELRTIPSLLDGVDGRRPHEGQAAAHLHHQPGDRRVGLLARPPADDVDQAADLGPGLVAHGPSDDPGQRHEGVAHGAVGQQPLAPLAAAGAAQAGARGRGPPGAAAVRRGRGRATGAGRAVTRGARARSAWAGAGGGRDVGPWGTSVIVDARPARPSGTGTSRDGPPRSGCTWELGGSDGRTSPSRRRSRLRRPGRGPSGIGQQVGRSQGGCGDAPGLLGGSPRFIGHTSSWALEPTRDLRRRSGPSYPVVRGVPRPGGHAARPPVAPHLSRSGWPGVISPPWTWTTPPRPSRSEPRSASG